MNYSQKIQRLKDRRQGLYRRDGVFGVVEAIKATGLSQEQALYQVNRLIDQQAFTRAADDIYLASSGVFLLLIGSVWLTHRPAAQRARTSP